MLPSVHPRFEGRVHQLPPDELVHRLENNCTSVVQLDFRERPIYEGSFIDQVIHALTRNTRVKRITVDLAHFGGTEGTFRALVRWLSRRGLKCEMCLYALTHGLDDAQKVVMNRVSIIARSSRKVHLKELYVDHVIADDSTFSHVLSLLSESTKIEMEACVHSIRRAMPYIRRIPMLDTFDVKALATHVIPARLCETLFSQQNIRRLNFWIWCEQELNSVVQGLVDHHQTFDASEATFSSSISLGVVGPCISNRKLAVALERIPRGLLAKVVLINCDFDINDVNALVRSLQSADGLKSLEVINHRGANDDVPTVVVALQDLFRGQLRHFELQATRLDALSLTAALRSSHLQTFHLCLGQSQGSVAHAIANIVPTMSCLEDLQVCFGCSIFYRDEIRGIRSNRNHHEFVKRSRGTSTHLHTYMAQDALVEAICRSPTILKASVKPLSPWQQDRITFAIKTRSTDLKALFRATNTALIPLALSRLSEGYWYDLMVIIVREKMGQLVNSSVSKAWEDGLEGSRYGTSGGRVCSGLPCLLGWLGRH